MTRPSVATVLSARPWEARLAAAARRTGLARLVGRIYEPIDLAALPRPDWLVVGAETAWLSAARVASVRSAGTAIIGVHPTGDDPGREALVSLGTDLVVEESVDPVTLLRRLAIPPTPAAPRPGRVVATVGPRGAGLTTVAIGLAGPGVAIVDTDDVPGVGPGLGLPPPPPGSLDPDTLPGPDPDGPTVLTLGALPGRPDPTAGVDVVDAAAERHQLVVVDAPLPFASRVGWCADEVVLVLDATVQGLLRGIALVEAWPWPRPHLVLNRVADADAVPAARRALGLEPSVLVPLTPTPLDAARDACTPLGASLRSDGGGV
ncbi:MAG: hypothetical protein AB1Z55_05980 [Acidimicrobiia bacterium]